MIKQDSVQFGGTRIDYTIVYSNRRKNASLGVYPMQQVEIAVPHHLTRNHIQQLVQKKASWILKQIVWFKEIAQLESEKEYVNGETFLFLGRQYRLKINQIEGKAEAKLIGKQLCVTLPNQILDDLFNKTIKAAIWSWYRDQTRGKVKEIATQYSVKLGVIPPALTVKNQSKRWGSCTSKNKLIFNFRLAMAPVSQIEYVVLHELCHTLHREHSLPFWQLVGSVMPDYENRKDALKKMGWQYTL